MPCIRCLSATFSDTFSATLVGLAEVQEACGTEQRTWAAVIMAVETLYVHRHGSYCQCRTTWSYCQCGHFARRRHVNKMFGRAFTQNSEIERASRCRGIDMLYGGYHVVHEVEAAPQKPLWGQKAYKCSCRRGVPVPTASRAPTSDCPATRTITNRAQRPVGLLAC